MRIVGVVEDGSGRASQLARDLDPDYFAPLGYRPHPGTLNVAVSRDQRAGLMRQASVAIGPTRYWPVRVHGEQAYVRVSRDPRTLEILHPQRLRDRPSVRNGERLVVTTPERRHMRLSVAIMAHPMREHAVKELLDQLDRPVPVIWDINQEPSTDPRQRWETGRRAWEAHEPTADWHMVLQDDIHVSRNLLDGLELALDQIGLDGLASAYTGTGRPDQANVRRALRHATGKGHSWMTTRSLNWGTAICAPVPTIPAMLDWCSQPGRQRLNYDMRIGVYYRDVHGWRTWYTVPSLVEHRELPSLVGHGSGRPRVAHWFHTGSALDIDWTRVPPGGLTPEHP